jgi:hypothetical protein
MPNGCPRFHISEFGRRNIGVRRRPFMDGGCFGRGAERVLIVHAFGHAYSPWSDMAGSFRNELIKNSKEPIDLYEVSLDTARVQDPKGEAPFVEYMRALLAGRQLDLIVPIGAPSAFFVQRNRQLLFPATPMLIVGADRRRSCLDRPAARKALALRAKADNETPAEVTRRIAKINRL